MNEIIIICLFILAIGACIGSFLNVVALRALSNESIVFPSSKCPVCNEAIKWYDNIPIFSYLFTFRGKCRNCGCRVSPMYPIVEAITSILFLVTVIAFGITLKTLLILPLLCMAIVITITDFKKEYIFDVHMWIFFVLAILYSYFCGATPQNVWAILLGIVVGAVAMEILARLAYFLVKKEDDNNVEEDIKANNSEENTEEDVDINEYVKKKKRAFGEGDTYLAAAVGALLGWKYVLIVICLAVVLQALCIFPQFFVNLYKQKENRLLFSLSAFVFLAIVYWILSNLFTLNGYLVFAILIALIFFAIDSVTKLRNVFNNQGFVAIAFGPALLISAFLLLFFGQYIISFLNKYIFMLLG